MNLKVYLFHHYKNFQYWHYKETTYMIPNIQVYKSANVISLCHHQERNSKTNKLVGQRR